MVKRPYLIVGAVGLLAMVPLAATSTNYMIKRLGPKRWQALHRLVYVAAVAGVVHFYMQVKSDTRLPIAFGIVLGSLLGYRAVMFLVRRLKQPAGPPTGVPVEAAPGAGRWSGQLRVERIVQETPDVRDVSPDAGKWGRIAVHPSAGPTPDGLLADRGKIVRRTYTIASTPTRPGYCEITTKREAHGLVSRHMHDTVKRRRPIGDRRAGGTVHIHRRGRERRRAVGRGRRHHPADVHRAVSDRSALGWADLFRLLQQDRAGHHLPRGTRGAPARGSQPASDADPDTGRWHPWDGARGRIDAALLTRVIPDMTGIPFYLCGPAEMLTATRDLLRQLGVPDSHIHTESFGSTGRRQYSGAPPRRWRRIHGDLRAIPQSGDDRWQPTDSGVGRRVGNRSRLRVPLGHLRALQDPDGLRIGVDGDSGRAGQRRPPNNTILLCQARALEDVTVEA